MSLLDTYANLLSVLDIKNSLQDLKAKHAAIKNEEEQTNVKVNSSVENNVSFSNPPPAKRKGRYSGKSFKFTDQVNVTSLDAL